MPAKKLIAKPKAAPRRAPAKRPMNVAAKPAAKKPAPVAASLAAAAAARKPPKQRLRLVRDSFTMPEPDFALIAALKGRAMTAQREAKKSELLRAGLHALMALDGKALAGALSRLEPLKLGRPKKGH